MPRAGFEVGGDGLGRIVELYSELGRVAPSPVIELNRAVAVSMHAGPEQALGFLDPLMSDPIMRSYHLLPSVRGDLLARLGRHAEASAEFERAASLTRNAREKTLLLQRAKTSAQAAGLSRTIGRVPS